MLSVLPASQQSQLPQLPRRKILTLQFSGGRKMEKTRSRGTGVEGMDMSV